jgi:RNA polymerase subunit RPABC4/transcription elongation factor Spt4
MDSAIAVILCSISILVLAMYGMKKLFIKEQTRKCLACEYTGTMRSWIGNNSGPQLLAVILLMFWLLPGLLFIAWAWGKYKCPRCGALGKNVTVAPPAASPAKKNCPFCAEEVMQEATLCRYCGRDFYQKPPVSIVKNMRAEQCPGCRTHIPEGAQACPMCGAKA